MVGGTKVELDAAITEVENKGWRWPNNALIPC
jgi:hypothetical protein